MNRKELLKKLGINVKIVRIKKELTQEKLAELTEIGERNLSKIECGKNFISAETLIKLSIAFKVPPYEIFKFEHLQDEEFLRQELINKLYNKEIDVRLLYKLYQAL